ncbi:MAG: hypothetical protein AABZ15_15365 [Nitrospirota bacterium]
MGKDDIEIIEPEEGIYHLRIRGAQNPKAKDESFWKVNAIRNRLTLVTGRYGERGGREVSWNAKVTVEGAKFAAEVAAIHEDLGMADLPKESVHASAWIESEKDFIHDIISKQQFDVLVIPVQVQDYAFDRIERSLMTKNLVSRLREATDRRVADPELIELALGRGARTYTEQRIYKLANALNARMLIRAYAGHNRDMKMHLTIVVQERPENGTFDTVVKGREAVFTDIPFSDEKLPSEAFVEMLPRVLAGLGFKDSRRESAGNDAGLKKAPLPASPVETAQGHEKSLLIQSAYLAVFGAFSPPQTQTSQGFFERSLVLLRTLPVNSADVVFLRSYALANLYRRPAALGVLGKPSTPEQAALRSYLDGDLAVLPARVEKIKNPIPKLLMQIAMNDLLWSYDRQTARSRLRAIAKEVPSGWTLFGERRLAHTDAWNVPANTDLKKYLDEAVPVTGYSLQDVLRGMVVRGDINSGDMARTDASVHEHRKRLLVERPAIAIRGRDGIVTLIDVLDLTNAWAEAGILKQVNLRVNTQGLYEEGIALVDRYETIFRGNPDLASFKSLALKWLARRKQGDERRNLERSSEEISRDACLWSGGQTNTAYDMCSSSMVFYENDFPRRSFWGVHRDVQLYGDRAEYQLREVVVTSPASTIQFFADSNRATLRHRELALRYEITDFRTLERYHGALINANMIPEADMLLKRNKQRFAGSPLKAEFMANQLEKKGDDQAAFALFEETIRVVPGVWGPFFELGSRHLRRGDVKKASVSFKQYPFFPFSGTLSRSDDSNTVALSNYAYNAGKVLRWAGEFHEAKPFFELSAGYDTGSASGMSSEYLLALYEKDYEKAADVALAEGRRYADKFSYSDYLHILRVVASSPDTDSLFLSLNLMDSEEVPWEPVITGLRMEGKSDDDVRAWLARNGKNIVGRPQARQFFVKAFLEDRRAAPGLADMIESIERQVELPERQRSPMRTADRDGKNVLSVPALYAAVRFAIEEKQYEQAATLLYQWTRVLRSPEESRSPFLMPYVVWSHLKTGKRDEAERLLNTFQNRSGKVFEYWLGTAMLQAVAGKDNEALRSLDLSRFNVNTSLHATRSIHPWYQLVEACEILFEETGNAEYRNKALELARMRQQMQPLISWTYAVEARYAATEEERIGPLAITLYLDPRSYRIADISEPEKEKARKWLETNNPFRVNKPAQKKQAAIPEPKEMLFATIM